MNATVFTNRATYAHIRDKRHGVRGGADGEPPDAITGFSSEIDHRVKSLTFTTRFSASAFQPSCRFCINQMGQDDWYLQ
jgi:hypothetical protein